MKKKIMIVIISSILFLSLFSCASNKPIYTRGWIGGSYKNVTSSMWKFNADNNCVYGLASEIKKRQNSALLAVKILKNTPAYSAELQEGDIICSINNEPVKSLKNFYKIIEKNKPGDVAEFEIFREGKFIVKQVKIGQEEFKKIGTISIGIGIGSKIDLSIGKHFSILSLLGYDIDDNRAELNSVEWNYEKNIPDKMVYYKNQSENWKVMLGIFQIGGYKQILSQSENSTNKTALGF